MNPIVSEGLRKTNRFREPPLRLKGDLDRHDAYKDNDDFSQAGNLYRLFTEEQKDKITSVIAGTMKGLPEEILRPNIEHFLQADQDYGRRIAKKVGLKL